MRRTFSDRLPRWHARSAFARPCGALLAIALCGAVARAEGNARENAAAGVDVRMRPMPTIAPGTVVGKDAPRGWSHLIVAAYPRIGQGDVDRVSGLVRELGSLLTFNMAAQVAAAPAGNGATVYQLRKVGWGLGARIGGKNTIITYETCDRLGADLGYLGNEVLRRNEQGLRDSFQQVARTPQLIVCDYGGQVLHRNDHRWMIIRHAVRAAPADGGLATLVWLLDVEPNGNYRLAEERLQLLPPALQEDRVFNVKADRFTLGIPANDAFAVARIPQGFPLAASTTLRSLAALRRFQPAQVLQLEAELVRLMGGASDLRPQGR